MELIAKTLVDSRRWTVVTFLVVLAAVTWIHLSAVPASATISGLIPSPHEGFLAPDFTLDTLAGDQVTLSDFLGKVIVINLRTSWHPPGSTCGNLGVDSRLVVHAAVGCRSVDKTGGIGHLAYAEKRVYKHA